ncbi:hypothetical protein [Actinoallomurus rhizosphaericola]|nr:hypothetical protein [Actinoallomurus rhizosphaericola]
MTDSPAEDAWLNALADEAESAGAEGSVSIDEMRAMLAGEITPP